MIVQDTYVRYQVGGIGPKLNGRVVGVAIVELPVVGPLYMVEDLSGTYPNSTYPYSCVAVNGHHLEEDE